MLPILINALRETLYMVLYSTLFSILIGLPLGMLAAMTAQTPHGFNRFVLAILNFAMQTIKTLPYILVMLLFIPTTNWLINHQISFTTATIVPLSVTGSLLLANSIYETFMGVAKKWQGTVKAMGASRKQSVMLILFPECLPQILEACANIAATMVGFTIIAGAFGAGGLGQLAIEKTITEPNMLYALLSILTLIAIQQLLKYTALLIVPQKS